jgi:putative transport protein
MFDIHVITILVALVQFQGLAILVAGIPRLFLRIEYTLEIHPKGVCMRWLTETLRHYPEIAIFLSLGIGYWAGGKRYRGFSLGAVTTTLIAAIALGQLGITVSSNVKSVFSLMFLSSVGYGVRPQFVRCIAKDGLPEALFSVVQCILCLAAPYAAAKFAGYSVGSAAGLFAGSQTGSASMELATDAINRLGMPADQTTALLDAMPTAYAATYIFWHHRLRSDPRGTRPEIAWR